MSTTTRSLAHRLVAVVAMLGMLGSMAACTAGDDDPSSGQPDGPATTAGGDDATEPAEPAEPEPYLPVPASVELTPQGKQLKVGQTATVAWLIKKDAVGVLDIAVTSMRKVTLKEFLGWRLDDRSKKSTPYFVRARVRNAGKTNLSGLPFPLYVVDKRNTLIQASSFQTLFKPCPSGPLPRKFVRDKRAEVCLVYLVPDRGELTAMSFRPSNDFNPITWTGPLVGEKEKQPGAKKGKKKDKLKTQAGQ